MNKIKKYTVIDFQQYHAGTMPVKDMYALEKAALEDPFLADALEGYEHTINAAVEIETIKQKLPPYKEEEKATVIAFNKKLWTRVAASVALFMGLGYLFFNLNSKKTSEPITKNEIKSEEYIDTNNIVANDSTIPPVGTYTNDGNISLNNPKPADVVIQMEPLKVTTQGFTTQGNLTTYNYTTTPSAAAGNDISLPPSTFSTNELAVEKTEQAKLYDAKADSINYRDEVKKSLRRDANVDNNLTLSKTTLLNNNASQNGFYSNYSFSGVVKTPTGGPMQNATIKLNNSNLFTKTDNNGRFNFIATDSVATVSVIASGFSNKNLTLNGTAIAQPLAINSTPTNNTLEDVVVVGYGNAKKKTNAQHAPAVTFGELAKNEKPVNVNNGLAGRVPGLSVQNKDADDKEYKSISDKVQFLKMDSTRFKNANTNFKDYVIKNIVRQYDEKGNEYKGKVILSFTTNKKGNPRQIKVVQSLNKSCDKQAKQLLENGPAWEINTEARNTVTIEF
jgi:hypothetical protein